MGSLISLLFRFMDLYVMLIIVDCIMSWIPANSSTLYDIKDALHKLTNPCYQLVRDVLPVASANGIGIDFAPMVAIFAIELIERVLLRIVFWF